MDPRNGTTFPPTSLFSPLSCDSHPYFFPPLHSSTRSKLNLVDLAGSERVAKSLADGRILKEAKHINLSLHHLEHVIVALQQKGRCTSSGHTPHSPYHTPSHPPSRQRREDSTSAMLPRQQSGSTLHSYSR